MVDPTEAPAPISVAVDCGTQLATALQTCLEVSSAARDTLQEVSSDVSATAAVLAQLQHVLYSNQGILKEEGLVEVNSLAQKCHLLFNIIIALVQAASDTDGEGNLKAGPNAPSIREKAVDMALRPGALVNIAPKMDADWLEPRIDRCQTQLCYLKMTVLLHLQIAKLAKLHDGDLRAPGTFDQESCFRTTGVKLRQRQVKLAKKEQYRQMREGRTRKWGASDETDSDSDDGDDDDDGPSSVNGAASHARIAESGNSNPVPPTSQSASPATQPAGETTQAMPPSSLGPSPPPVMVPPVVLAAASTSQSQTTAPGPTAPPYSAHTPVGHHGMEFAPMPGNMSHPAEKSTLGGQEIPQGSHELKPLIPAMPVDDAKAAQSNQQASPGSNTTAATALELAPITALFRPTFSQRVGSWFSSLASNKNKLNQVLADQGSTVLEAYLVGGSGTRQPIKIPLSHEQLKTGLARTLRANNKGKSSSSPFPTLLNLTVFERGIVDRLVRFACKASPHQRTCVAIQQCKTEGQLPSYLAFFSLAEPLPAVQLKDAIGRKFSFPYQLCKEWNDMKELINAAFIKVNIIGPHVMEGHYDLLHDGGIILPSLWSTTITPGASIVMHMWPMNSLLLPSQPPRAPAVPPPPPPPGWIPSRPQPVMGMGAPAIQPGAPPNMFMRPNNAPFSMQTRPANMDIVKPRWCKTKKQKALEVEYRDMMVVDFAEEAKLDDVNGVADMIRRFTSIEDAEFTPFDATAETDDDLYYFKSDSDSDSDASSIF